MVISGRQSVETAEYCGGFGASTKRKFLWIFKLLDDHVQSHIDLFRDISFATIC